jgi:putative ABC transport system substrate-binding protein
LIKRRLPTAYFTEAQQTKKIPRIGYLSSQSPNFQIPRLKGFQQGIRELGYVEGQNIAIEYRYAEGKMDRLSDLAAELVRLDVDVIVAHGTFTVQRAQQATTKIPIVMTNAGDPVATGLVASLARPGGNVTGLVSTSPELTGKRLELFKEALPNVSRVALLWNPTNRLTVLQVKEIQAAAPSLGLQIQSLEVRDANDFETAFSEIKKKRAGALLVLSDALANVHASRIADFARKNRLPVMLPDSVETGGLMSYGVNIPDLFRRAAYYVDKILKGTKPADIPVEQPTKFELVINLKTAKQIGLTIPPNVLARANRIIR